MPSCCVVGCKHTEKTAGVHLHRFPVKRMKLWSKHIHRQNFKATKNHRICSAHFVSGYPGWERSDVDWVPTLLLRPPRIVSPSKAHSINEKLLRNKRRSEKQEANYLEFLDNMNARERMAQSLSFHNYAGKEDLEAREPKPDTTFMAINDNCIAEANLNDVITSVKKEPIFEFISRSTQTSSLNLEEENQALRNEVRELRLFIENHRWSVN